MCPTHPARTRAPSRFPRRWTIAGGLLFLALVAATNGLWLPRLRALVSRGAAVWSGAIQAPQTGPATQTDGHDHDHAEQLPTTSIELSERALKNIGFQPLVIATSQYTRTIRLPGMVVEKPGRSQIHLTAPLTGVISRIHAVQGAAVEPGSPLFEIRLTHEELVAAQSNLIRTAGSLDVVELELARLNALGDGVVAGKRILEQEYEKRKLEAGLRAERQALLLHGLSEHDVEAIVRDRRLFQTMQVSAPGHDAVDEESTGPQDFRETERTGLPREPDSSQTIPAHAGTGGEHPSGVSADPGSHQTVDRPAHLFHIQALPVQLGQQVEAGQLLCVLADHCELFLEGQAFEDDVARLRRAAAAGWEIQASQPGGQGSEGTVRNLRVLYLADHVDPQTRAFRFYLGLPNRIALDQTHLGGGRFLDWEYKPGQRFELQVPVEQWEDRIVLPVEAVVDEGAEVCLYRQNGSRFERVPVHVEYRDPQQVVIANDGAVFPGDIVAGRGAWQMHLALQGQSGPAVDPHAGHNH